MSADALAPVLGEIQSLMDAYNLRAAQLHGDREVNEDREDEVDDECGYVYDEVVNDLHRLRAMVENLSSSPTTEREGADV